jgi:SAM-dependent methyltransferase
MVNLDSFTSPKLTPFTLDTFIVRKSILEAVKIAVLLFSGDVLDIGCGYMPYREIVLATPGVNKYIGLDFKKNDIYRNKPDLTWDGRIIPLQDNTVHSAMATELFEHCPEPELVIKEIVRVLCPGGILFFTIPFLWPLHDVPHDQYRYTPFSIERHLANAGFHEIHLQAMGGWDESMAQMIGLYVRRRPMSHLQRFVLSLLAFPFIYLLAKLSSKQPKGKRTHVITVADFPESLMITGICGVAYKPEFDRDIMI